jgi:two-component sensor histidine kinase
MSFAALHEQMYQSRSESIELLDAVRRIAEINRRSLASDGVSLSVEGEPVRVTPGAGTNLCIMANELLTNALKHGCSPEGHCEIRVTLWVEEGRLSLRVWNSGNPVAEGFDVRAAGRTGLELVQSMVVEQYGGSFALTPHRGGTLACVTMDKERLRETP